MLKKIILAFILCFIVLSIDVQAKGFSCKNTWDGILERHTLDPLYKPLIGLCGVNFRRGLWDKIATNKYLEYKNARHLMFAFLDNFGGRVCGVYSGTCVTTSDIPDHRKYNTEHSWCQSWELLGKQNQIYTTSILLNPI